MNIFGKPLPPVSEKPAETWVRKCPHCRQMVPMTKPVCSSVTFCNEGQWRSKAKKDQREYRHEIWYGRVIP